MSMVDQTEDERKIDGASVYVACRISSRLKDAMDMAAAADDRTKSGLLRKILTGWLKEKGYLK